MIFGYKDTITISPEQPSSPNSLPQTVDIRTPAGLAAIRDAFSRGLEISSDKLDSPLSKAISNHEALLAAQQKEIDKLPRLYPDEKEFIMRRHLEVRIKSEKSIDTASHAITMGTPSPEDTSNSEITKPDEAAELKAHLKSEGIE